MMRQMPIFGGGLKSAPVMMTLGFFNNPCKARIEFWRVLAIVPNLSLGKGKSDTTDPEIKAQEHHLVLRSVFEELERISNEGGIKTTINGKNVVLKFWIHSIIGDTKGHNEMCGHNNSSRSDVATRLCLCSRKLNQLSTLPLECVAITTSLIDSHSEAGTLDEIGQKNIDNVFDHLPMGHPTRGVHACTAFDDLHVWGNGLHPYIIEAFAHLLFTTQKKKNKNKGKKGGRSRVSESDAAPGPKIMGSKKKREAFDKLCRVICRFLDRQSERDFPRRAFRGALLDATRLTAMEAVGNVLCLLVAIHTKDGHEILKPFLRERKVTMKSIKDALIGVLCYQCWLLKSNPSSQVISASNKVNEVMNSLKNALTRPPKTDGWELPKFHGAVLMLSSIVEDGPGEGTTTMHGENMHKTVSKGHAKRTQRRAGTLAAQISDRHHEHITLQVAARNMSKSLLIHKGNDTSNVGPRLDNRSYWRSDFRVDNSCIVEGMYVVNIPSVSDSKSNTGVTKIAWSSSKKHKSGTSCFNSLLYALSSYARVNNWNESFRVTGFTSLKKMDQVQLKYVRYRCDPHYRGRIWRDWCNFRYAHKGNTPHKYQSPAMILGFVRFDTPGFPSPFLKDRFGDGEIPQSATDKCLYAVVRGIDVPDGLNFEDNFITRVKLVSGKNSIYIQSVSSLVGPVCVIPDIHNIQRNKQDKDSWLVIQPRRLWGDLFGRWVDACTSSSDDNVMDEDSEDDNGDDGGIANQDDDEEEGDMHHGSEDEGDSSDATACREGCETEDDDSDSDDDVDN